MTAATVTFTPIVNEYKEPVGSHNERLVLLTVVFATSTYTDGGLADATNFKAGWFRGSIDLSSVRYAIPEGLLKISTFEEAWLFEVDVTNRKIILFGNQVTPIESESQSEPANGFSLIDGTYTCRVRLKGDYP